LAEKLTAYYQYICFNPTTQSEKDSEEASEADSEEEEASKEVSVEAEDFC